MISHIAFAFLENSVMSILICGADGEDILHPLVSQLLLNNDSHNFNVTNPPPLLLLFLFYRSQQEKSSEFTFKT